MNNAKLQLQSDLTDCLNSESYFATIPVAKLRDLVIAQEIQARLPHLAGKGGKFGCGIIVNMPETRGIMPNVAGQSEISVSFDVVENPELNFDPVAGTLLTCEEVADQVRLVFEPQAIQTPSGWQNFRCDEGAEIIAPIPGINQLFPGCAGYRVSLKLDWSEPYQAKVATPTFAESDLTVTLACATGGAAIYYALDGSWPGPGDSTGAATLYTVPFAVTIGQYVRYKAYLAGSLGSDCPQQLITS